MRASFGMYVESEYRFRMMKIGRTRALAVRALVVVAALSAAAESPPGHVLWDFDTGG